MPCVNEWERVIDELPQIANGWTKCELLAMHQFLGGEIIILDGLLRVMPTTAEKIEIEMTVSETRNRLAQSRGTSQPAGSQF